ncbi:MAG: diacylglycerol kinase family lipid kinase [Eubacterium sp.]|nr:diacylglycerol kinase family lipid kinase [Eubacterium sp.]
MRGLFIINPSSGRQNFRDKIKEIAGTLIVDQICSTIDIFYTEKKDDARNKAASLKSEEYDFVVAVGGDGTLNEVVSGIVEGNSHIPLAVISAGTVNDFATYLKLPQEPADFCEMIRTFRLKKVDVGKVNERYFINVVAAGMFSDVGFKVPKDKKASMGKFAYYLEGAADLPKQLTSAFKMRFTVNGKAMEEEVLLFMVANSRSVGGFREIAPLASTSDGILDLIIIKKMDIFQVAPLLLGILNGDHVNHPAVEYLQADHLLIENLSGEKLNIDYDGEQLMSGFPLEIRMIAGGINILVSPVKEEEKPIINWLLPISQ